MAQKSTPQTTEATVEDLSEQIRILRDDLSAITHTIGDFGRSKSHEATKAARDTAAHLSEAGRAKANELADTTKSAAIDAQAQTEHFIRTQPATALGIAAGLGFLIGMMTARK